MRGSTAVYGIIGWPVAHSLSPAMQSGAFRRLGMDATFVAFPVEPARVAEALGGLHAAGVRGLNVTTPHKAAALAAAADASDAARRARSANVLVRAAGGWIAHTTDGAGMVAALSAENAIEARGLRVTVLGSGAAARSIAAALAGAGAGRVEMMARDVPRARRECGEIPGIAIVDRAGASASCDLAINTVPPGAWSREEAERILGACSPSRAAVDLTYGSATPFLDAAMARGVQAVDGLGLLLHQGALSLGLWLGIDPPVNELRAALEDARRSG